MARVKTNNCSFAYAIEEVLSTTFGTLPTSPRWKQIEPNEIDTYGAEISTVSRYPISKNRQRRKGTITDLDSSVEFKADLTFDSFTDFIEGFLFAQAAGAPTFKVTSVVAANDRFNLDDGDTAAGVLTGSLIVTRGFLNAGNNSAPGIVTATSAGTAATGVFTITVATNLADGDTITIGSRTYTIKTVLTGGPNEILLGTDRTDTGDNIAYSLNGNVAQNGIKYSKGDDANYDVTAVNASGVVTCTARRVGTGANSIATTDVSTNGSWGAANLAGGVMAYVEASALTTVDETVGATQLATLEVCGYRGATGDIDVDANGNLTSTALDFTTLGLEAGQFIWVGGADAATSFVEANNVGFARVSIAPTANLLTLDKKSQTFVTEANTTSTIDLYFGRYIRNVTVDDADYIERRFQFEAAYPDLAGVGTDEYEYAVGNYCDEVEFELPLSDKAGVNYKFIGTDTEVPTTTRKTGASSAKLPDFNTALNTTADIARLRITQTDETGITTDFKDLTLKLANNVSPEKVLGTLGARFMNNGIFEVDIETQVLFTSGDVTDAIRNNTTVTMDFALTNADGGIVIDIPAMTLGDGKKDFPVNETVMIGIKGMAFIDPSLGTSLGVSLFPLLP